MSIRKLFSMLTGLFLVIQLPAERIVFLGDSLTAGFGLEPEQAFPHLVGETLREAGQEVTIVNAGVSGDTSAGGLRRVDWILRQPMDTLIIALGANDGLRGQPAEATRENLTGMIRKAREKYPELRIVLAGMLAAPNMGEAYRAEFDAVFPAVAEAESVELMPFLLEGVAGRPELNLDDGIHPNPEGHRIIAKAVVEILAGK